MQSDRPQISSGLTYDDPEAAIEWLARAFGFEPRVIVREPGGSVVYNELWLGDGYIGAGHPWTPEVRSPGSLGGATTQSLYAYVEDVDAHYEQAIAAGARIIRELETAHYGERGYTAMDCGGHVWSFGHRVDDAAWAEASGEAPPPAGHVTQRRPDGRPQIWSNLHYNDPAAAIDWLVRVFGFKVRVMVLDPSGGIAHNELGFGEGIVSAVPLWLPEAQSPASLGGASTQHLQVNVDDADAHYTAAREQGARIFRELETAPHGIRGYGAFDCEGHIWFFGQRVDEAAWEAAINGTPVAVPA
jgi:uncharacterized glyoxalase superfamily protein PhnB